MPQRKPVGLPRNFGRSRNTNLYTIDILLDGTDYSTTLTVETDLKSITTSKENLKNDVYKTKYVIFSFRYWYATTEEAGNRFSVLVDGVQKQEWTGVNNSETDYSVWLQLNNNNNHTITVRASNITVGRVVHLDRMQLSAIAELG